ncbi:MAG TPA: acyltransferase [Polyangiaceae bacterium]|jgi:peptidoglycan/LPS O-acetylase OafA/YrhL
MRDGKDDRGTLDERLEYLDALRGMAILGVVLVHTSQLVPLANPFALQLFAAGKLGVQMFFVVSAFTLWSALRRNPANDGAGIAAFFVRRAFRILPAYWLGIVAWSALYAWSSGSVMWLYVLLSATFCNGVHPDAINYIPPGGWSITDEATFYLFVPFLARKLTTVGRAVRAFAASALVASVLTSALMRDDVRAILQATLRVPHPVLYGSHFSRGWFLYFWFPAELPVFLAGVVAFRIADRWRAPSRGAGIALVLVALEGMAFVALSVDRMFGLRQVVSGACFAALLLGLRAAPLTVFVNAFLRRLGRVSFSIYLIHYAFRLLCEVLLGRKLNWLFGAGSVYAILGLFVAITLASWACAEVTFRFVERPGIELGARVSRAVRRRLAPEGALGA